MQERLVKLKTTTSACELEDPALNSENQELKQDIGDQSVVCSVENCNDTRQFNLENYGRHFSVMHRNLELDKLLVTSERGVQYSALDMFKFVYRCGFSQCSMLFFGIIENSKAEFIKKIRDHWTKSVKGQKHLKFYTLTSFEFDSCAKDGNVMAEKNQEFGGIWFKCQECQAMITYVSGSQQFSDHLMSHSSNIPTMRFFKMDTGQVMVLGDLYPNSAQCQFKNLEKDIVM